MSITSGGFSGGGKGDKSINHSHTEMWSYLGSKNGAQLMELIYDAMNNTENLLAEICSFFLWDK